MDACKMGPEVSKVYEQNHIQVWYTAISQVQYCKKLNHEFHLVSLPPLGRKKAAISEPAELLLAVCLRRVSSASKNGTKHEGVCSTPTGHQKINLVLSATR